MRFHIVLFCLVFIAFASCCEDDSPCNNPRSKDCPNYDPCIDIIPADASFRIIDSLPGFDCNDGRGVLDLVYEVDTIWNGRELYFKANSSADTYTWKVGTDPTLHSGKEISIIFGGEILGDVDVTLITTVVDSLGCIEPSLTIDSLTKHIHFIPPDNKLALINGMFRGVDTDKPLDTFIMGIPCEDPTLGLLNFPNSCNLIIKFGFGYKGLFILPSANECGSPCGIGLLQPDNKTLIIDYSIRENNMGERVLKKFIGTKVE